MNLAYSKKRVQNNHPIKTYRLNTARPAQNIQGLCINTLEGLEIIPYSDILYCSSESNYTTIFCRNDRKVLVSKTLKLIQEKLPENQFCRIHQSHVVALESIMAVGKDTIVLENEVNLPVSNKKKPLVKEHLKLLYHFI